eukprot:Cvel_6993.t1-p1 / transcript=Cvel_6993.t1 / gene=Cvel_6993 / organism=Chromera_velia_CCMP2878 / gene_product=Uncharacterized protein C11orf70 homolog, putative / transcript_product=Uncharacterized protein C11orf70 homolog, putative / location=Cvel_scaffold356:1-2180(-) / protein_length=368 / sequence_SO=supercontig / SO=protein_coding / is_pseudo=false
MVQITEIFEEQEEAPPPVVQSKKPSLEEKEKKCGANLVPPKSPAPPEEKEKEVSFPMKIQEEDAAPTAFTFKYLNDVPFTPIHKKENQELLFKWGLQDDMKLVPFRYDQNFLPRDAQTFLDDFFSDKEVRKYLQYLTGMYFGGERTTASFSRLTATKTTLKFLKEPLQTAGIVGPSGHIRGRLHEDWEGIPIVDQLRECLLMEESELWDSLSTPLCPYSRVSFHSSVPLFESLFPLLCAPIRESLSTPLCPYSRVSFHSSVPLFESLFPLLCAPIRESLSTPLCPYSRVSFHSSVPLFESLFPLLCAPIRESLSTPLCPYSRVSFHSSVPLFESLFPLLCAPIRESLSTPLCPYSRVSFHSSVPLFES